jgi:hypothetical protein
MNRTWIILSQMKYFKWLLVCCVVLGVFVFFNRPSVRPQVAVCSVFQNEAPWLKEWVKYHHDVLGVSHFYLYNNDSTDNYYEILKPYIDQGVVEIIDWSSKDLKHCFDSTCSGACDTGENISFDFFQAGAFNDCLKNRALGKDKWVAIIDIDEFIVSSKGAQAFYDLLVDAEKMGRGSILLHWRMFGTSNVETLQEGELLTEKLTWRGLDDHPWSYHVKSIHRPEAVALCNIHTAYKLNEGYQQKVIKPDVVCIHHYWTRTERFCLQKRGMTKASNPEFFEAMHQVKDETMLKFVPNLKSKI